MNIYIYIYFFVLDKIIFNLKWNEEIHIIWLKYNTKISNDEAKLDNVDKLLYKNLKILNIYN